jgi:YhcH/YjgK/YiaL family protein
MIIDTIDKLGNYVALNPLFADVEAFIKANDLQTMEPGKYPIKDKDLFLNLQVAKGRTKQTAFLETHVEMIDIQIPLSASETFGYTPLCDLPAFEYNVEKDIQVWRHPAPDVCDGTARTVCHLLPARRPHALHHRCPRNKKSNL